MLPTETLYDESQLTFSIAETPAKQEVPNDLRSRYWEALEKCPGAIADKTGFLGENQFHPLLMINNEADPQFLSDLYLEQIGSVLRQKGKTPVFYRLAEIHTSIFGEIQEPIHPGKGFAIEEVLDPEASKCKTLEDGTQLIYVGAKEFDKVTEAMNGISSKVDSKLAGMGIHGSTEGFLMIVQDQLSLLESQVFWDTRAIVIGGHGIDNIDKSDLVVVTAHELTHGKVYEYLLRETGLDCSELFRAHPYTSTIEFFQEGAAVAVQEHCLSTSAKTEFKAAHNRMYPKAAEMLSSGEYKIKMLNLEEMQNYYLRPDEQIANVDIHSRLLPGAFTEFCQEQGVELKEMVKLLVDNGESQKLQFAKDTGRLTEEVSFDYRENLTQLIKDQNIKSSEISPRLNRFINSCDLSPFELMAKVQGKTEKEVISEFLKWVDTDE